MSRQGLPTTRRLGPVDVARGIAVLAMVIYHTGWDLGELRLTVTDLREVPAWNAFARTIAASFLLMVGAGLVLAHRDRFRPRAFLRRLATVAGAALAVSVVTLFVFPTSWIFFGILHCIAVSSVLALPFLRLAVPFVLVAAFAIMAQPFVATVPLFDWPPLAFTGLGGRLPDTNDYVPLFPWFGVVLLGVALTRLTLPWLKRLPERTGTDPGPVRWLAFAGRHSLVIYLVHQPLVFGVLAGYAALGLRSPDADAAPFRRNCELSCRAGNTSEEACRTACACVIDAVRREEIWPRIAARTTTPEDRVRVPTVARECFAQAWPGD